MSTLSIAIIAKNEEQNLRKLLPLVQHLAHEIVVVVDSSTTDETAEYCRQFGAMVFIEDWKGLVAQKQSMLDKCTQEWILSLDCDEFPDALMIDDIAQVVARNEAGRFLVRRRTVYLGRALEHAWQPDVHLRLVPRSAQPHIVSINGHDMIQCQALPQRVLKGWLMHYSYTSIRHHFEKTLWYARIGAENYASRGKRFSALNLFLNPCIAFVKMGILRGALLDGIPGLLACVSTWLHVFLKYAMLWEIQHKKSS